MNYTYMTTGRDGRDRESRHGDAAVGRDEEDGEDTFGVHGDDVAGVVFSCHRRFRFVLST